MTNLKIITVITLVLMVMVSLLDSISFVTKLLIDGLLFAGWGIFAVVRTAGERRRLRRARENA